MSGFLLDTNVVSEMVKPSPEGSVLEFLTEQPDLWLSVIVFHEMKFGLDLLPQGNRRRRLSLVVSALFAEYDDRILPVDRPGGRAGRSVTSGGAQVRPNAEPCGRADSRDRQGSWTLCRNPEHR